MTGARIKARSPARALAAIACVAAAGLVAGALGVAATTCRAWAFDRIVPIRAAPPRSPPGVARGVLLARLAGRPARAVWCLPGGAGSVRVAIALGHHESYRRCRALRVTTRAAGRQTATLFGLAGGSFWARPVGASRGVTLRALGPQGVFRKVTLATGGGRLFVSAQAWTRAAHARYSIRISGVHAVRMAVREAVRYGRIARGMRDRPALAAFYDYGVANHMPAAAVDLARHDADGLWLKEARSISWLPLRNPPRPWSRTYGISVRGFGLWQRDRARRYYGVHAAREQDAPDVFVRWTGRGGLVVLRERPSAGCGGANVRAVFVPGAMRARAHGWLAHYRLAWERSPAHPAPVAAVVSTLIGGSARAGTRKYVIDYAGGALTRRFPVGAVVGRVHVQPDSFVTQDTVGFNPYTGGYRQVIQVMPVPGRSVHVRAWLDLHGHVASEIWRYALFAPRVAR